MSEASKRQTDATTLLLQVFEERIAEAVRSDEEMDYEAQKVMLHTQRINRVAQAVVFLLTPVVFFLIWSLVLDMGTITERMQKMASNVSAMNGDFQTVANIMSQMDGSVVNMSQNMAALPAINQSVANMGNHFSQMTLTLQQITPSVGGLEQMLTVMEQDMSHMNGLFGQMNKSVTFLGRDVNTMSGPMRWLPSFFGR